MTLCVCVCDCHTVGGWQNTLNTVMKSRLVTPLLLHADELTDRVSAMFVDGKNGGASPLRAISVIIFKSDAIW